MTRSRRGAAGTALLLIASAGLTAGCGERAEPTSAAGIVYPVTVENPRGTEAIEAVSAPARIAVLDGEAQRILEALDVTATLGADENGNPQLQALADLRPELIVAGQSNDSLALRRMRTAVGAPVYIADGDSIAGIKRTIRELGLLTNRPLEARRLVARISQAERKVAAATEGRPVPSVFIDLGAFTTVGERSLIGELIRAAGGRSVVGPSTDPGPVPVDRLVELNPDIYLASSDAGTTLEGLRADPEARKLTAVRRGRFVLIPHELLQAGPGLDQALVHLSTAIRAHARS
jgi:ABC-type Fe3+-hydroxamate transport system substrate-binding protein